MRFVCESCHAQYAIRDEKVGPRGVATHCRHCGHRIVVKPLPVPTLAPVERSETRVMALHEVASLLESNPAPREAKPADRCGFVAAGAEWFVASDDVPVGPLDAEQIRERLERREVTRETLCWKAGMTDWRPLAEVAPLGSVLFPKEAERPEHAGAVAVGLQSLIPQQAEGPATPLLAALVEEELHALQPPPLPAPREPEPEEGSGAEAPAQAHEAELAAEASHEAVLAETPDLADPRIVEAAERGTDSTSTRPVHLYLFAGLALWFLVLGVAGAAAVVILRPSRTPPAPPTPLVATAPTVTVPTPLVVPPPPPVATPVPEAPPTTPIQAAPPTREATPAPVERAGPPRRPAEVRRSQRTPAPSTPTRTVADTRDPNDKAFEDIFGTGTPTEAPPAVERRTLEYSDILEVLVAHQGELKVCTSRAQEEGLSGTAVLRWSIRNDGTPANVQVLTPEFQKTPLSSCLVAAVRGMRFPAYSGPQLPPRDVPVKF